MFQTCSKSHFDFFLLLFCDFVSLFFCLSSSCLFYSPTVNVQLHTTWADNKGVFQWKTHSFPLDSRHLFNTEQHMSTAPFQSLLWRAKKGRFSKCAYHSKSEIYSFFSKNVCNTQFWSLVLAIEAMRDELHHLPDDDPGPTPKIKFGMVYLTIVFNMEFIKNLCCLRNSGMLIRHFMLAHLKVCRPFVMRVLVKNHGNRHTS